MAGKNLTPEQAKVNDVFANAIKRKQSNNKKQKEITVGDKDYIIKRWKANECLDRMPTVANLLIVPAGAINEFADNNGMLDYTGILFNNLQRLNESVGFSEWVAYMLDEVYVKGESTPIGDVFEEFEVLDILTVLEAVLEANFMIPLCVRMLRMTDTVAMTNDLTTAITPSESSTSPSDEQ